MHPQVSFLLNQGLECLRNSNLEGAERYLKQAVRLQSNNPHALRLLGVICAHRKQYPEALNYFKASLKALPKNPLTLSNLGNVYLELKEYKNALDAYDQSIKLEPLYEEAWTNKGNVLHEMKRFEEALAHHDKAISLNPNYAEAWSNKGNVLVELKRHEEAIASYDHALTLNPNYAEAWSNKGNALGKLKRFEEALAHQDRAISLRPDYHEAWTNKAGVLSELKRYDEALAHFEKAIELNPDVNWLFGTYLHLKMKICSWVNFSQTLDFLVQKLQAREKIIPAFPLLSLIDDPSLHLKCSEIFVNEVHPVNHVLGLIPKIPRRDKIRIGYFSADFKNHAVSILTAELFELHDRDRFETIAFSSGPDDRSLMRLRLMKAFDKFIDVSDMPIRDIAEYARGLSIDIAIDLGGFTAESRIDVFAYRVAPIQVSYIGYLGTLGSQYMDYLVADHMIIPRGSEVFYTEKIVYLPSYQVNDSKREISEKTFTREELGLPDTGFVFACFNNNYKILPAIFDSWMKILQATKGSVLFLYAENEWAKANLKQEAEARGVSGNRILFGSHLPADEYLARYRSCDLFLDTAPYNAGATASDALWAGLPVLTCLGQSFASRVASSLLTSIGLPELITSSFEEYQAKAIDLAFSPEKLEAVRVKLAEHRSSAPLFDTPLFTRNLEAAYIEMYERYQADLPPESISIT